MTGYRRNSVSGGCYFFTVNLADRRQHLLIDHVEALRAAFREVRSFHPFAIEAMVVLPDHLHAIWTLPDNDANFATRWRRIKSIFSQNTALGERVSSSRAARGERGIWQRRFWEHTIRDERDYERHVNYIHFNPVKHGHVTRVSDWPYSSFHRYVARGIYPADWGGDHADPACNYGERSDL